MNTSFDEMLESSKWDAEFAEGRENGLIDEYYEAKADGGEQGHDGCFPNISGPGATVWIERLGAPGFICLFDSTEEAFEFGHAFLREHTSDLKSERMGFGDYVYWQDDMGAVWAADYRSYDSINHIMNMGGGIIGKGSALTVGMYNDRRILAKNWSDKNVIVPAGVAMILGTSGVPNAHLIDTTKNKNISTYILAPVREWRLEVALGKKH